LLVTSAPTEIPFHSRALSAARIIRRLVTASAVLGAAAALLVAAGPAGANPPLPHDPIGAIGRTTLAANSVTFAGWAADPDDLTQPATVYGAVDGRRVITEVTDVARPGVAAKYGTSATPGFVLAVPVRAGVHTVCLGVRNDGPGVDRLLRCRITPAGNHLTSSHSPMGLLASVSATAASLHVLGWAADPDDRAAAALVVLYVDGRSVATRRSFQPRPTATLNHHLGHNPGFDITVPVSAGSHVACLWVVNVGYGSNTLLGCQAVDTRGPAGTGAVTTPAINRKVVVEANKHLGERYVWGAEGPKTFDCSGLVQYSYGKAGLVTPRIAADQFAAARLIPASRAVPGDLVFYHDSEGQVFHVGIYIGPGMTDAAVDTAEGVRHQPITDLTATYGSFTHD
jgi:cell wall-associated NlpC family hydrolase